MSASPETLELLTPRQMVEARARLTQLFRLSVFTAWEGIASKPEISARSLHPQGAFHEDDTRQGNWWEIPGVELASFRQDGTSKPSSAIVLAMPPEEGLQGLYHVEYVSEPRYEGLGGRILQANIPNLWMEYGHTAANKIERLRHNPV